MGNKHSELEICLQLQGYDLIGIRETWCDGSHDWHVAMKGYSVFRKDGKEDEEGELPSHERAGGVHGALPGDG